MTLTVERPTPETATTGRRRAPAGRRTGRQDIEGLRALAVGLVVLYDAGLGRLGGGFVGVDVFFVISGFLITGLLLREFETSGRISITAFYARRLRRIVPASSLTLVVTVVASGVLLGPVRIGAIAKDALWSSAFLANFRFIATGTDRLTSTALPSPLQHFWSLAVGAQFYLVWPGLLWLLLLAGRRQGHRIRPAATLATGLLVVASLAWCVHETATNASSAYFSPWTRAWELAAGALVALALPACRRLPRAAAWLLGYLGLGAVLTAAAAFSTTTRFPGIAALLPVAGTAALIAAGSASRQYPAAAGRLLGIRPLTVIGGLSYPIYLWHWPLLIIAEQRHPQLDTAARLWLVLGAVLLAYLTHALVENPARFAPALMRSRSRAIAFGLALALVSAAFANAYVVTAQGRVDSARAVADLEQAGAANTFVDQATVLAAVAAAPSITAVPGALRPPLLAASDSGGAGCYQQRVLGAGRICYLGDRTSAKTAVLYGDSHAGMWSYPLDTIASRAHLKLVLLTDSGCPDPVLHLWSEVTRSPDTACDQWHQLAAAEINRLDPSLVVVTSAGYAPLTDSRQPITGAQWEQGWDSVLRSVSRPGRVVQLIGDIPYLAQAATNCLSLHPTRVADCATPRDQALRSTYRDAEQRSAEQAGVRYLDPLPWLCSALCTPVVHNFLVYKDQYHLTSLYASYLAGSLAQAMGLAG
jgi:peptidoglycan/LPS O-acetylase OafA/YrhL